MTDESGHVKHQTAADGPRLAARLFGIILAPRNTFVAIVRCPHPWGVLIAVCLSVGGASGWLISTEVGQQAALEQQVQAMESFGLTISDEMYTGMRRGLDNAIYFAAGGVIVWVPLLALLIAGVVWIVCYVAFGVNAPFKAIYAVVAHVGVVNIVQQVFVVPLNYTRGAMTNPATLGVFFPMLDVNTFAQRALSLVDLFVVWQLFLLAIGVAVLYKRRTAPIAATFYGLYAVTAIIGGLVLSRMGG